MGLDATVRCRCFEEGKLKPGPIPFDDLFVDEEGYLSSRKLSEAYSRFDYRQFQARYGALEDAFREWLDSACEHEGGDYWGEHVGNWSGVGMFQYYCEQIGEETIPVLFHILPDGNGGIFPAEKAPAALAELDIFDAWLDAKMKENPTGTLVDSKTGKEVWSPEDDKIILLAPTIATVDIRDGLFCIIDDGDHKGDVIFSSSHLACERLGDAPNKDRLARYADYPPCARPAKTIEDDMKASYQMKCHNSYQAITFLSSFEFCENGKAEFRIGSRKAWPWTFANVALRRLLEASVETGNPIRWC